MLPFSEINQVVLVACPGFLYELLPDGCVQGNEFAAGSTFGEPGDSFSANLSTGKLADFASDERGRDLVSLYAKVKGLRQSDAARMLAERFGVSILSNGSEAKKPLAVWKAEALPASRKVGAQSGHWKETARRTTCTPDGTPPLYGCPGVRMPCPREDQKEVFENAKRQYSPGGSCPGQRSTSG